MKHAGEVRHLDRRRAVWAGVGAIQDNNANDAANA